MFLHFQPKPTPLKHVVYLISATILGVLLSFMAHVLIEINYINYALTHNIVVINQGVLGHAYCALPAWLQIGLLLVGIIGGYFLGVWWWNMIYVKQVWRKKFK